MELKRTLRVEVAYVTARETVLIAVPVPPGTSLREAVQRSGIAARLPGLDLAQCALGVFGVRRRGEDAAQDGDRIEIYRPLACDPKERRRRAARRRS